MFISVFLGFVVSFSVISGEHASTGSASLCTHAVLCSLQLKYIQIQTFPVMGAKRGFCIFMASKVKGAMTMSALTHSSARKTKM